MRPTGSLTLLFLAACAGGCSRDLGVPGASPPGISTVAVVGLETRALASKLPVLAGERVAVSGSGFPDAKEQVQVQVGGEAAKVVSTSPTRLVLEVPVLGATGEVDLTVTTSAGFGTLAKALRYDGPGLPHGTSVSDLETAIGLAGVVPVEPGNATTGFADVAVGLPTFGRVYVARGGPSLGVAAPVEIARAGVTSLGSAIAGGGDLDADGIDDLLIGAPYTDSGVGRAFVYFGGASFPAGSTSFVGPGARGSFGYSLARATISPPRRASL